MSGRISVRTALLCSLNTRSNRGVQWVLHHPAHRGKRLAKCLPRGVIKKTGGSLHKRKSLAF
jgi:hypothetical protein